MAAHCSRVRSKVTMECVKTPLFVVRLARIIQKGMVFCMMISLLLLMLYFVGNYQEFLDSSQFLLLELLTVTLSLAVLFGLYLCTAMVIEALLGGRFDGNRC